MQVFIGDLTTEQFARLIGVTLGTVISVVGLWLLIIALLRGIFDGWLFRKGALYYGSFRLLNVRFRDLKRCGTLQGLNRLYNEICMAVTVFQYQRIIPKFLCVRILDRLDEIYVFESEKFLKED